MYRLPTLKLWQQPVYGLSQGSCHHFLEKQSIDGHAEPLPLQPDDWLGADLDVVNIAADPDGTTDLDEVNGLRKRHVKLRQRLQQKGPQSAKRLLKKRSKQENWFVTDVNHRIVQRLVAKTQDTGRGIALEDLTASVTRPPL
jgi:transposase